MTKKPKPRKAEAAIETTTEASLAELIAEETDCYIKALEDIGRKWAKAHGKKVGLFATPWARGLAGQAGVYVDSAIIRLRPKAQAIEPNALGPGLTGNASRKKPVAMPRATEQSKPHDPDLLAERLLKATSGKKK